MKYAVIKTGGKQIKTFVGKPIWVEKINGSLNKKVEFKDVLILNDGDSVHIGGPKLNASVIGIIQKQGKGPKLIIFRTKAKSNWSRKQGHRQPYTRLMIEKIIFNNKIIDQIEVAKIKSKVETMKKQSAPVLNNHTDIKNTTIDNQKQQANDSSNI